MLVSAQFNTAGKRKMKVGLFTGTLWLLFAFSTSAQTCATQPRSARGNDKRYAKQRTAGDRAFREGKYDKALAEYLQALASTEEGGFFEIYFKLGETYTMVGDFDKAYACLVESGPGKIPGNRVMAVGIRDEKARKAAQLLLDTIQLNTPRYPYGTFPEYLALAAILRHVGLTSQAKSYEEDGRINREAANAWEIALAEGGKHASLAAADRAAIGVYERHNRPEPAGILRAQLASEPPFMSQRRPWWFHLDPANW
jgi:tetratricopeptide (TPR) repeat protein